MEFDGSWAQFKTSIYDIEFEFLCLRNRKHRDWFDENNLQMNKIDEDKKNSCTINTSVPQTERKSLLQSL